ncbi:hypothetical protein KMW28_09965 [Flammeovirga yaeyamensis]|uniref:DUF4595 domain-containing protein n=1 Tax=Flammeovirga yaeyamensis TaxID=367791 RepID=A0AAX1N8H3_9BACT|nr:hypothetical protein [Flammeovirga yaeyamensis]MBB3698717.1 hypothetical protein [Flammeovirga yaeyamensis]NMF37303.1 hypothetical protein [Flammeovirga yaeyamensis]QWG03879.1 hypothetical protein KMW28_09965 [Flammeovirga yaeyamensis]
MYKLVRYTLILSLSILAFSCDDSEDEKEFYNTSPISGDCSLQTYTYSQVLDSAGVTYRNIQINRDFDYTGDNLTSYTYSLDYMVLDTNMVEQRQSQSYQIDFSYNDDGTFSNVTSGTEELLEIVNVDGRLYSLKGTTTSGGTFELVFEYDDQNRVEYIVNAEDVGSDKAEITYFKMTYNDAGDVSRLAYMDGDFEFAYNEYRYNEDMRNPTQGMVFYIISLVEAGSFDIYGDPSTLSGSISEFFRLYVYNTQSEDYDYTDWMSTEYIMEFNYQVNDKNYPVSSNYKVDFTDTIKETYNETYSYTNCQ